MEDKMAAGLRVFLVQRFHCIPLLLKPTSNLGEVVLCGSSWSSPLYQGCLMWVTLVLTYPFIKVGLHHERLRAEHEFLGHFLSGLKYKQNQKLDSSGKFLGGT